MSGDHRDDRGRPDLGPRRVPLPTEPPGELAEVFPLHPPPGPAGLAARRGGGWWSRTWPRSWPGSRRPGCPGWATLPAHPRAPVLIFLGEGGERAMVRRLAAICAHKHLDLQELAARRRLRLCFRVPKLTSGQELGAVAAELAEHPAALVVVTHWNKTGEGRGAKRISGVGPGAPGGGCWPRPGSPNRTTSPDGAPAWSWPWR